MTAKAEAPKIADDELLITREFNAPVALVFRIWESREHLLRWWGPKDFRCTHFELDFRPGGSWRACIESEQYGTSWMSGVYREIERNRRIVFTFMWEDGEEQPGVETLVTVDFIAQGDRTLQRFHQTPFLTVSSRDSHVGGWRECWDNEQAYIDQLLKESQA